MKMLPRTTFPVRPDGPGFYIRERNDADVVCEGFGPDVVEITEGHPRGMLILRHFCLSLLEPIQLFPVVRRGYACPKYIDEAIFAWWNAYAQKYNAEEDGR